MGNVDIENVKSYMKQLTTDNFKISDSGAFAGGTIVNGTSMLRLSMDELESMKYVYKCGCFIYEEKYWL